MSPASLNLAVPLLQRVDGSDSAVDLPCFLVARSAAEWSLLREAAGEHAGLPATLPEDRQAVAIFLGRTESARSQLPEVHAILAEPGRLAVAWEPRPAAEPAPGAFVVAVIPATPLPVVFCRRDAAPSARPLPAAHQRRPLSGRGPRL